jgi:tRNA(Glu) U13 pseudouridine synthase TruD
MNQGATKEECQWILIRIVKCLMTKKKFTASSYSGRQLKHYNYLKTSKLLNDLYGNLQNIVLANPNRSNFK